MATLNEWKRKEKFREEEGGGFLLSRGWLGLCWKSWMLPLERGSENALLHIRHIRDGRTMLKGPSEEPKETLNGY